MSTYVYKQTHAVIVDSSAGLVRWMHTDIHGEEHEMSISLACFEDESDFDSMLALCRYIDANIRFQQVIEEIERRELTRR